MRTTFNKYTVCCLCFLLLNGISYAGLPPLTLSGPTPAIITPVYAGNPATSYIYTIKNNTKVNIPVTESVSGNSTSITISTPCSVVPAQQTCSFIATVNPSFDDSLLPNGLIQNIIHVNYNGRLPSEVTSEINVNVITPTLTSISISPLSASISGGQTQSYTATGYFVNGSSFNITAATNWQSSNTAVATIGARTGIALGLTTGSTNITGSFQSITSDASTLSVTNYAYIVNNGSNTVESCIAQANGTITNCNTISGFTSPYAIAINPTRTFAYITEPSSNQVKSCNISFTSCSSTGENFDSPTGIALDPKGHFAYITNGNDSVTYCNSDPVTGTLSSCTIYYLDNNLPTSAIVINKSGNIAYIISNDPSMSTTILYYCSINTLTGALSDCASTGSNFLDNGSNLGLALASDDSYLYISNTEGAIYACPINSTNNKVESCTNTGATNLSNPYGLSIGRNNEYAFIANFASNQIVSCTLTNAYTFSNCQIAGSTGTNPTGVVVN